MEIRVVFFDILGSLGSSPYSRQKLWDLHFTYEWFVSEKVKVYNDSVTLMLKTVWNLMWK